MQIEQGSLQQLAESGQAWPLYNEMAMGELSLPITVTASEDSSDGRMMSKAATVAKRPSKLKPLKANRPGGAKPIMAIVRPTRHAVQPGKQAEAGAPAQACTEGSAQQPLSLESPHQQESPPMELLDSEHLLQ
jgi:hypothetical protein